MTATIQIILLFTFLFSSSAFAAQTPQFFKVGNGCCRTNNGKKILKDSYDRFTNVVSLETCKAKCTDTPACSGIEYTSKNGGVCEVHTAPIASASKCRKVKCYIAIQPVSNAAAPPPIQIVAPPPIIETSLAPTPAPQTTTLAPTTTTTAAAAAATTTPAQLVPTTTQAPTKTCTVYPGVDFYGGDLVQYGKWKVKTVLQCAQKCVANPKCAKFTWAWKQCFLKTAAAGHNSMPDAVSAICEFPATPAPTTSTSTVTPTTSTTSTTTITTTTTTPSPPPPTTSTAAPTTAATTSPTVVPTTAVPSTTTSTAVPSTDAALPRKDITLELTFPHTNVRNLYTPKLEAQGGAVNGKLYVFGGFINGYKYMDKETWEFSPHSKKWRQRASIPAKWTGATHMANAVDERTNSIYLLGGITVSGQNKFPKGAMGTSDVFRYDAAKNKWSTLPSLPEARGGGAAVVLDNKLHFFNGAKFDGRNGGFQEDMTTHWQLDLGNTEAGWKTLSPNSLGRNHVGGVAWGGKIYAIGGQFHEEEGCSNQKLAEAYNPATDAWTRIADLPIGTGHISPATLAHEHGIIVVGGVTDKHNQCKPPGNIRKQLFFYNPTTDTWTDYENEHGGASRVSGIINGKIWSQHDSHVNDIELNFSVKHTGASYAIAAKNAGLEIVDAHTATANAVGSDGQTVAALASAAGVCVMVALAMGVAIYKRRSESTRTESTRTISHPQRLLIGAALV